MFQSLMLRSQSSIRFLYCGGCQATSSLPTSIGCRISSAEMNQSSTTRNTSGVRDLVPRDHAMLDVLLRGELLEGRAVVETDEVLAAQALDIVAVGENVDRDPVAVCAPSVQRVGLHRGRDVRRQRPGGRRPDD